MVFVDDLKIDHSCKSLAVPHHSISFAAYFRTAPPTLIIKPDYPKFTIVDVNAAYLEAVASSSAELIGMGTLDAIPTNPVDGHDHNVKNLRSSLIKVIETREQDILPSQRYDIPLPGGEEFITKYWKATNSPLLDSKGEVEYIVHVVLDITQAVKTAEKERFAFEVSEAKRKATMQMEERLRLAIDSAALGTWHIDANSREFVVSPRFKELFGFKQSEVLTFDDALNQIDAGYRKKITKGIEIAFGQRQIQDLEFPVVGRSDGKFRWLRATGRFYAAQDGKGANFSGTVMDITKLKLDEQRKNDFIAMVSHELKTPLTSLNGYIQLLQVKLGNNAGIIVSNILDKAKKQVGKMISMIEGFLNVSRLEAGKIQIQPTRFDMAELIKEIEEDNELDTRSRKLLFSPVQTTWVDADRDKIELVITNLISNAIKYSPMHSTVQITCLTKEDKKVEVSVRDEGMGVQPEDQAHLFDRFYRVENQQTASIAGFGIGLYICKEIIERHKGKIWVESEPGRGSTFSFCLPLGH